MDAPAVRVKRTENTGLGLFADRAILKGKFIIEYTGSLIKTTYADTLTTRYLFDLENGWTIDGSAYDNIARYINHSCKPNAAASLKNGHIYIYAEKNISPGTEITMDYGEEYFKEFIKPHGCRCRPCAKVEAV